MLTLYGIKNCDTMKKAMRWLDEHSVAYQLHNYKTAGLSPELLQQLCQLVDWQQLLNTRGTTWRKLDEATKTAASQDISVAKAVMLANPSVIKRPILSDGKRAIVGFNSEQYQQFVE